MHGTILRGADDSVRGLPDRRADTMTTDRPDMLAALIDNPARAVEVPADAIPSVLEEVGTQEARLGTVKAILAARLATVPTAANGPDRLLTAQEVHERTTFSVDWLYRKAKAGALPFARPIGRKVLFSQVGLAKWLAKRTP